MGAEGKTASLNSPDKSLWITWHDHQRTRGIIPDLGIDLFVRDRPGLFSRHILGSLWAMKVLWGRRPRRIFLHFSYQLLIICVIYKLAHPFRHVQIICDCHNKALKKTFTGAAAGFLDFLKRWSFRHADLIIVSNELLVDYARGLNENVITLRDAIPPWPIVPEHVPDSLRPITVRPFVFFVCTFDRDEPVDVIADAARRITQDHGVDVVISGRAARKVLPADLIGNPQIHLSGFLPTPEYQQLLSSASAVVVLTGDHDCLVCGAYEAVAAERPLVLSDTDLLRKVFGDCAVYCRNEGEAIAAVLGGLLQPAADYADRYRDSRSRLSAAHEAEMRAMIERANVLQPVDRSSPISSR